MVRLDSPVLTVDRRIQGKTQIPKGTTWEMNTQIITGQNTRGKPTQSFDGIVMKGNGNIMSPVHIELSGRWEMRSS